MVAKDGAAAIEVQDAVVVVVVGVEKLCVLFRKRREQRWELFRGLCVVELAISIVPLGEGDSPLGRIGSGPSESWKSTDCNLATLESNISSLLDFSTSDA